MLAIRQITRSLLSNQVRTIEVSLRYKSVVRTSSVNNGNVEGMASQCKVRRLDHLVLTVLNLDKSINFYTNALGMSLIQFGEGRKALQFGDQKINLHLAGREFKPHAKKPAPGSADLCFISKELNS